MMKLFEILAIILLSSTFACSQSKKMFDIDESYKGVIVTKDVDIFVDDKKEWFEPTLEEVKKAEQMLANQIEKINKWKLNQVSKQCPVIDKNLNKYIRQYIGYTNTSGEKIILINMLWAKDVDYGGLDTEYILVFDGCSHYWKVKVNLSSGKVYDLEINGSA
ncbi:hypothetical protein AB9P05_18680 [Roseivirga sp. BDSF3-8]|uniref:hypothetical protein n=1 Tax=Roseivirga sp. BDSF3-8 TaxID=3241598 RepID=UPI003531A189